MIIFLSKIVKDDDDDDDMMMMMMMISLHLKLFFI